METNPSLNDFNYKNNFYRCSFISCHDGDTVTLLCDVGFKIQVELDVRIKGMDTFELTSKVKEERALAFEAREKLREYFTKQDRAIWIKTQKTVKGDDVKSFERYVADVYMITKTEVLNYTEFFKKAHPNLVTGKFEGKVS